MKCKVEGCSNVARYPVMCLCSKHYARQWRYGTTDRATGNLERAWAEAWESVRAAREQQARTDAAMRSAGARP